MKKEYIVPSVELIKIGAFQLLSGSGIESDNGIGFGGVDEGGVIDPDAHEFDFSDFDESFSFE